MSKLYGALVGAPIQGGGFPQASNFNRDGVDALIVRDRVALATTNVVGDTVSLGSFRSTALFSPSSRIWNDALGASVTLNIGDANYPSGLGSAIAVSSAGAGDLWRNFTPGKMSLPLWQALGYSADPGGFIELLATVAGANVSTAGALAWQIHGANR